MSLNYEHISEEEVTGLICDLLSEWKPSKKNASMMVRILTCLIGKTWSTHAVSS